jgi:hypothetical protein
LLALEDLVSTMMSPSSLNMNCARMERMPLATSLMSSYCSASAGAFSWSWKRGH